MIGQHLILRCAKGCYDSTAAAGLKTAAVSDNVSAFPNPRQQELNKVISEHAAFPDLSAKTGSGENRGVLRLFEYRGVLMAMRTARTGSMFLHTQSALQRLNALMITKKFRKEPRADSTAAIP